MLNDSLHNLAKQAKTRLRNSYTKVGSSNFRTFEANRRTHGEAYEQILYSKVVKIIEMEEDFTSPLDKIVDHRLYELSDDTMRQKLMLDTSRLYIKLKARYYENLSAKLG